MKMRTESEYFHPRPFVGNNIDYRIGSSASMARFKESQTFILGQLAFNPFHEFSVSAKEILLFKFDIWFDLLCEMEQYILIKQDDMKFEDIWEMSEKRQQYAFDTLNSAEVIDDVYFERYLALTTILKDYHKELLMEIMNTDLNPASIFGATVDLAIRALNHILYVVQELDVMMYTEKTPMINLDSLSCEMAYPISNDNFCPVINRLEVYRNIRPFDEIIIKDYIEMDSPFYNSIFHDKLNSIGIKYKLI